MNMPSDNIVIRKATREDENELAELAYRAYYDRFFNRKTTDKFGASLSVYPELIPNEKKDTGQSLSTFRDYWKKAMRNLNNPEKRFICFVAEANTPQGKRIIGFRKGYALPLDDEEYRRYANENKKRSLIRKKENYFGINTYNDIREIPLAEKNKIAGSSSLYTDPDFKRSGIGKRLIKRYAQEVLKLGFKGMATSCYIYNDSQKFLKAMGGDYFIRCNIPCTYRKNDKTLDVCNIAGLMCLWDEKSLKKLAFGESTLNLQYKFMMAKSLKRGF